MSESPSGGAVGVTVSCLHQTWTKEAADLESSGDVIILSASSPSQPEPLKASWTWKNGNVGFLERIKLSGKGVCLNWMSFFLMVIDIRKLSIIFWDWSICGRISHETTQMYGLWPSLCILSVNQSFRQICSSAVPPECLSVGHSLSFHLEWRGRMETSYHNQANPLRNSGSLEWS